MFEQSFQKMASLKRSLSDSDCDDLFSDTKDSCMTPPGTESCGHNVNRKKRRGIIEKRRRDRINNSLTELRRLVPTAFEKQGSAKLEKAEILQMTVDHLKMLHSKGLDALAYDNRFALDYHTIGFRECANEVGRYLVNVEGMNTQDPLRCRLLSHLQCFATQREIAHKQASSSSWTLNTLTQNPSYSTLPPHPLHHHSTVTTQHSASIIEPSSPEQYILPINSNSHLQPMSNEPHLLHSHHYHQPQPNLHNSPHHHQQLHHTQILNSSSPHDRSSGSSTGSYHQMSPYPSSSSNNNNNTNSASPYIPNGKPYRPWGAEVAY